MLARVASQSLGWPGVTYNKAQHVIAVIYRNRTEPPSLQAMDGLTVTISLICGN